VIRTTGAGVASTTRTGTGAEVKGIGAIGAIGAGGEVTGTRAADAF
jgi:hypothetical protein